MLDTRDAVGQHDQPQSADVSGRLVDALGHVERRRSVLQAGVIRPGAAALPEAAASVAARRRRRSARRRPGGTSPWWIVPKRLRIFLVLDAVAADLHAAVAQIAGLGLLDLADLDERLEHRRREHLGQQRLGALGLRERDEVLPERLGERDELAISHPGAPAGAP